MTLCATISVTKSVICTDSNSVCIRRAQEKVAIDSELTFGDWLRRRRRALDLTRAELAEAVGCSVSALRKFEAGDLRPSRPLVEVLAGALQIPAVDRAAFVHFARDTPGADTTPLPIPMVSPPHPAPPSTMRSSLPAQPTPLIGREQECAALGQLLRWSDTRLVTLTGPGGIGKTRLGLHVATELIEDFADGVYFVDLAPIREPPLVISAMAQTLGIRETGGQPLATQLQQFLGDKRMLLLLDNFEHLLDAAPLLAELLANASRFKLLVTSRAHLHVRGEQQFPVPPLRLPDLAHLPDVHRLTQYAAVALFIERAQAVQPTFQMTSATAPAVAAICAQLDGLPLAIELAAVRIKLFSPEELLARLSSRLTLLTGGARDLPARQQTIRATIDWSYKLLSSAEQRLFRQLGVFVGGCTLDAAEVVCRDRWPGDHGDEATERDHPAAVSVLDGLAALIDKNLVRQAAESGGDTRFEMLETIREYALEHLADSGELELLQQRHAEYFLALVEAAAPEVVRAQGLLWMERLATEYSNLRMVLAWSIPPQGQVDLGMRLAVGLLWYWIMRNHWGEGYVWLARAARLSRQVVIAPAVQANVLRAAGIMAQFSCIVSVKQATHENHANA